MVLFNQKVVATSNAIVSRNKKQNAIMLGGLETLCSFLVAKAEKNITQPFANFNMKKLVTKLKIKRTSTSPYFSPLFNENEKNSLAPYADFLEANDETLADILITNTHTNFTKWNKKELDHLKLILHPNSGHDNFPEDFVRNFQGTIVVGNPIRSKAVAEYILSSLYSHFSPVPSHYAWSKERKWPRKLLAELKISLIGFGHVGKILHDSLVNNVEDLNVFDPYTGHDNFQPEDRDVIILAASLNSKNCHLINQHILKKISPEALIINAARGELINTLDLVSFLKTNSKAFAVLDVFEEEPNNFCEFINLNNIKLTSHIAGVYKNIDQKTIEFETSILKDFCELSENDFNSKHSNIILKNKIKKDIGLI